MTTNTPYHSLIQQISQVNDQERIPQRYEPIARQLMMASRAANQTILLNKQ